MIFSRCGLVRTAVFTETARDANYRAGRVGSFGEKPIDLKLLAHGVGTKNACGMSGTGMHSTYAHCAYCTLFCCCHQAQYFSTGDLTADQFFHYGLALDLYTHFTSPIRRYADLVGALRVCVGSLSWRAPVKQTAEVAAIDGV